VRVDVWLDLVCPWCFIGKRRLERALQTFPGRDEVDVVLHSFELDPGAPATVGEPTLDHLAATYGMSREQAEAAQARVTEIARGEGLAYRLDATRHVSSFDAHRLLHLAREHGVQLELAERLMQAHFCDGEDISDPEVLQRLAEPFGLGLPAGDAYADAVRADEQRAAGYGIHGVPFFVLAGRYAVEGAQPAELLAEALATASSQRDDAGAAAGKESSRR
jgi:predicted DsbA family dithiol-disulfide isomerase